VGGRSRITAVPFGATLSFGRVKVSFHPAGHILGSAQIRVELGGEVWVASGDYKRDPDPSCEPFEVVRCDTFVTEATFGRPSYQWGDPEEAIREIHDWWEENAREGCNSLLHCYALGKSQRVLAGLLRHTERPVWVCGETAELTRCYRDQGVRMVPTLELTEERLPQTPLEGELIIIPPGSRPLPLAGLGRFRTAFASGWMSGSGGGWARGRYDRGFALSDHADWPGLLRTIEETGAHRVLVLHGKDGALIRHLRKRGIDASLFTRQALARGMQPFQLELFRKQS
jgi:putative mRNA 3-end processing factor